MRSSGHLSVSLAHLQTWALVSRYEFKTMQLPRAWMSTGRAARLAAMMCLHKLDGDISDIKYILSQTSSWIEQEERRRTFWNIFLTDRCASIGNGWPMQISEDDVSGDPVAFVTSILSEKSRLQHVFPHQMMRSRMTNQKKASPSKTPLVGE